MIIVVGTFYHISGERVRQANEAQNSSAIADLTPQIA